MGEHARSRDPEAVAPLRGQAEAVLRAQREALEAALNGAPLETSLGVLVRAAVAQYGADARAAFYLVNAEGTQLHHLVGMPPDYAAAVDGFPIGRESVACGLAMHIGRPVFTPDVREDPLWAPPWLDLAERFAIRGCWSFPIHTRKGEFVGAFALYWRRPRDATPRDVELGDLLTQAAGLIIARDKDARLRARAEARLREREVWLAAEKEAFQAAMNGEPLERSLGILVRTAVDNAEGDLRCAFYIADEAHETLRHVVGMPKAYARRVDGLPISPESRACGLAVARRVPVITPDVFEEPRWREWRGLAQAFDYRSCWSFPLETASGRAVGSLAMYFREPREPTERDLELAATLSQTAAIIISRHQETEQRARAEAELRKSEARYRTLFETIDEGFCVIEMLEQADGRPTDYRFVEVNPAFERHTGLVEVTGKRVSELTPGTEPYWIDIYAEVARSGEAKRFANYHEATGRWYDVYASRADGADKPRVCVVFADISDRKQAETTLRASEERFRQFADASSDVLWVRDARTLDMEFLSAAFEAVYGVESAQAMGDVRRWAALIVPEDRGAALAALEEARAGRPCVVEFRIQRPADGSFRWVRTTTFPLRDERGHVRRIGGLFSDVTEAHLSVEHRAVLLAELQHRVRNIMAMIRSMTDRTAESAGSVAEYASLLSGRLLTLARVQALLTRAANVGVSVAALVQEELNAHAVHAGQFDVEGPDIVLAPKAAEILTLAVHELTTNALKHGGLSTSAGLVRVRWTVLDNGGDRWLSFDWSEEGAPGGSAPAGRRRRGFGSELIEVRIPYELGGRGKVAIAPGGARCHLEFPLKEGASILETDAPQRARVFGGALDMTGESDLSGRSVLVIEDDYYLATDTVRALRAAGAEVIGPCPTEEAARAELETQRPSAAVVDINLGGGPSFGLARTLSERGIPFVFTTGYDREVIPKEFAGVERLEKPIELRRIVDAVANVLDAPA